MHPNRLAQEERLKESTDIRNIWFKTFGSTRSRPELAPAEGWITPTMSAKLVDPLGFERIRHDVPPRVGLLPAFEAQGKILGAKLKKMGMDRMDAEYHELWDVPSVADPNRHLTYRMENLVHTNNIVPADTLPSDFESMDTDGESGSENEDTDRAQGILPPPTTNGSTAPPSGLFAAFDNLANTTSGGNYRSWQAVFNEPAEDRDDENSAANDFFNTLLGDPFADDDDSSSDDDGESSSSSSSSCCSSSSGDSDEKKKAEDPMDGVTPTTTTAPGGKRKRKSTGPKQRAPSFMSINFLQRRWLELGYTRHQVGNAIGLCFMAPWKDTQVLHTGGRIHTTGANNRRIDRLNVKHATCAYMKIAGVKPVRLKRRRSQNLVAGCSLPAPRGLCMHLLCAAHGDIALPTNKFTGVSLRLEKRYPEITQTLLVFDYGNTIAVGSNSRRQIDRLMSHAEPILYPYYRNAENEELEKTQAASGTIVGLSNTLAGTEQGQKRHETRRIRQERRVGHNVVAKVV